MAQDDSVIVKKVKKGGHAAHHGGAWKVAYADFVTAMMAFFLLLWLLNATTEDQRQGLADYFSPTPGAIQSTTGGEGMMSGQSVATEGAMTEDRSAPGIAVMLPDEAEEVTEEEAEEVLAEVEEEQFAQVEESLREAMEETEELAELGDSLIIDQSPEGLRIQIVDQEGIAMFRRGSTSLSDEAQKLIQQVTKVIEKLPNKIAITGHTDATRFTRYGYDNWDLSTDRANSSRRGLIKAGLPIERIFRVTGRSSEDPLDTADPTAPVNRRISIVLLRKQFIEQYRQDQHLDAEAAANVITQENEEAVTEDTPKDEIPEDVTPDGVPEDVIPDGVPEDVIPAPSATPDTIPIAPLESETSP